VAWDNFARFVEYTGELNWFLPHAVIPAIAVLATCAEAGWQTRITAACSGILLMTFGLSMTLALGIKAPLNFSVFSAAGGSLLLATCPAFPFSGMSDGGRDHAERRDAIRFSFVGVFARLKRAVRKATRIYSFGPPSAIGIEEPPRPAAAKAQYWCAWQPLVWDLGHGLSPVRQ